MVLPSRKQPVPNRLHRQLSDEIPDGTKLGPYVYVKNGHFGRSWRRLLGVLDKSGFRKAEWAARKASGSTRLTYRQVAYCFDGSDQPIRRPSLAMLQAPHFEVWLYIYPVPSKCDPDGSKFCTKAIPFKRLDTGPGQTVQLFIEEEIRMHQQGVSDEQRFAEPLFSPEPGVAFHRSAIDAALAAALLLFVSEAEAAHLSWHSWRVRLACKLKAAGCDNPTIQAMVRWATDQAVSIYARYERDSYWDTLHRAAQQDATSVQFTALPEIDEMLRVVEAMGLTGQPWATIEQKVLAVASTPALSTSAPASQLPIPQTSVRPLQSPSVSRVRKTRNPPGLPDGWSRVDKRNASGRSVPHFLGPHGAKARSLAEAWRKSSRLIAPLPTSDR